MLLLDTSALLKRYVQEEGRDAVLALMAADRSWAASRLARTEASIALCRVPEEADRQIGLAALNADWVRFLVVATDEACHSRAADIGCATGLRTLDAIHLAAAEILGDVTLITFDRRLAAAATQRGIRVAPDGIA